MLPPIRGFIESTLLDWEGKVAAVVFLPGCNFRCGYCHARHLVEPMPSDEAIPLEAVLVSFRRQRGWLDGVVISGGEPTLHPGLLDFIRQFRAKGIAVKLDTNGSRPDVLERLLALGVLDYVAMDVKAPLDGKYAEVARAPVDLDAIRRSIELLIARRDAVRIPHHRLPEHARRRGDRAHRAGRPRRAGLLPPGVPARELPRPQPGKRAAVQSGPDARVSAGGRPGTSSVASSAATRPASWRAAGVSAAR